MGFETARLGPSDIFGSNKPQQPLQPQDLPNDIDLAEVDRVISNLKDYNRKKKLSAHWREEEEDKLAALEEKMNRYEAFHSMLNAGRRSYGKAVQDLNDSDEDAADIAAGNIEGEMDEEVVTRRKCLKTDVSRQEVLVITRYLIEA